MHILSVEASGNTASVALVSSEGILGELNLNYKKQHSVLLMPMIEKLLNLTELSVKDLDGFVVSKGPGSFTGLRIGMATVKGLSLGSDKPVIAVSSLDALAYNIYTQEGIICSMMDALRGNVYCCLYRYENELLTSLTDYKAIALEELIELLKEYDESLYFVGDGTLLHGETLKKEFPNASFAPNHLNYPRASSLGELGIRKLALGRKDDLNDLAPIYLRRPQAEREYDKKMRESHE